MNKKELVDKLNAIEQLNEEKKLACKLYKKCNECPNLLSGGYCEIKLALSRLNIEINDLKKN